MKIIKKEIILLLFLFTSLLFVKNIYGYLTKVTEPQINEFSILQNGSYTVRHEIMNLDGSGNPQRYFTGTLKNMNVRIYE